MSSKRREKPIRSYRVRKTISEAVLRGTLISAAEFKRNCLSLIDEVRDKGVAFIITEQTRPVAHLVPVVDETGEEFIGRGAGMIVVSGDIVAPTSPDWDEGADI
jgi:antitoxin (DNA-binding transcriptional repressor) of toxin-antitoxin stability system